MAIHLCIRNAREEQTGSRSYWNHESGGELPESSGQRQWSVVSRILLVLLTTSHGSLTTAHQACGNYFRSRFRTEASRHKRQVNLNHQPAFGSIGCRNSSAMKAHGALRDG